MAWPYGLAAADPAIYAYIMNALSQYPYPGLQPNPGAAAAAAQTSPFTYYASLGLQRAAAGYSPYALHSALRPRTDLLPNVSSPIFRPTAADPHRTVPSDLPPPPTNANGHPCSLHQAREHGLIGQGSPLGHRSSPCSASPGEPCNCHLIYGASLPPGGTPTSLPAPTPLPVTPLQQSTASSQPSLFKPYENDSERS